MAHPIPTPLLQVLYLSPHCVSVSNTTGLGLLQALCVLSSHFQLRQPLTHLLYRGTLSLFIVQALDGNWLQRMSVFDQLKVVVAMLSFRNCSSDLIWVSRIVNDLETIAGVGELPGHDLDL